MTQIKAFFRELNGRSALVRAMDRATCFDSNIDWGQDLFYLEDWYEFTPGSPAD